MIFFESQKIIDNLIKEIDAAEKSIDIEMYIWDPDKVGILFEEALIRAVDRGVSVRLMVDRFGSMEWITTKMDAFAAKGIEVRVFRPMLKLDSFFKFYSKRLSLILKLFNRRNHRKVFIIDNKTAYVGSLNILEPALKWKETTLRTEDSKEIKILSEIYNCTWDWVESDVKRFHGCDFRKVISDVEKSDQVRTTQTPILRKHYRKDFLKSINEANDRIWLITPYFNPPRFLLKALIQAAKRGVDVRLMVPLKTDPIWFSYLSRVYYSPLIKRGLRVFEYEKGILHAKTSIIDSTGIVGSGNLNYRSFYRDLELNIIVSKEDEVKALEDDFKKNMSVSNEIVKSQQMSLFERAFGTFLTKFKTSF